MKTIFLVNNCYECPNNAFQKQMPKPIASEELGYDGVEILCMRLDIPAGKPQKFTWTIGNPATYTPNECPLEYIDVQGKGIIIND
jgi:hypothetical protein